MRFALVPLILAAFLAVGPTAVHANTNQAAAERIAASLAEKFPGPNIHVAYQNGKVRLVGKVGSENLVQEAAEYVKNMSDVRVTEIDNGLQVDSSLNGISNVPTPRVAVASKSIADVVVPMPNQAQNVVPASAQQNVRPVAPQVLHSAPIAIPREQATPYGHYARQHGRHQMPIPQQVAPRQVPQQQATYYQEAYGPQGPMPGQYNHPNLPEYAWPAYASYPNYAQVSYPRQYSPKAWPYIGPFYPYPQTPLEWRKVTMEYHRGWWWLDFDNGEPSGPFSPLFREPIRYTY